MVNKIERKGVLRDRDVIRVQSEGQISNDNDNLPPQDNLPVPESVSQSSQRTRNREFGHNGLCLSRIEHYRNSRSELLQSVGVDVTPTHLHIFELFIPKVFIKEVGIPNSNKSMVEGYWKITCG